MNAPIYHLVHANIAEMRADYDDPIMAGFVARIDAIDALAREASGFIAQPSPPDEGKIYPSRMLLNISIWESVEHLKGFTYSGSHAEAYRHRTEWFLQTEGPNYVLYWAPAGQIPTEVEIKTRIDYLAQQGPTPYAFTFRQPFSVEQALAYNLE
jgi:hypothetical protein